MRKTAIDTMGYDLQITRAEFWAENDGNEISADEWLRLVERDAELEIDAENGTHFALWNPVQDARRGWFDWLQGNVYSKNPDRETFAKMLEIAERLDASLQGDDGESYASLSDFPTKATDGSAEPIQRSWVRANFEYVIVAMAVLGWVLYDVFWR